MRGWSCGHGLVSACADKARPYSSNARGVRVAWRCMEPGDGAALRTAAVSLRNSAVAWYVSLAVSAAASSAAWGADGVSAECGGDKFGVSWQCLRANFW